MSASEHPSDEQLWLDEPSVRRHVEACPRCRQARDAARGRQEAVAAALAAATPAATRMPQTVEHRLAAALQNELPGGIETSEGRAAAARPHRRRALGAGLAAAAVVLVLVGTVVGVRDGSDPVAGVSGEDALLESAEPAEQPADASRSDSTDSAGTTGLPPVPPTLVDEAERSGSQRAEGVQDACGSGVLDDAGDVVLTVADVTTDPRGGVLVTVDGVDGVVLWWLPSCEAGADDAYGRSPR